MPFKQRIIARASASLFLALCSALKVVGRIGFMNPAGWPGFELGWTLGRESWGKGFATEGAQRALEYAFTEMNRDHVISLIAPDNVASIPVAERLGEKKKAALKCWAETFSSTASAVINGAGAGPV
jgi:RimJ/RimL family protein N-acetyltransferase